MRFQSFLSEGIILQHGDSEKIRDILLSQCQPFMEDFKRSQSCLFSGRKDKGEFGIRSVRTDRRPKDMGLRDHYALDKEFQKKFGFKARSECVFAIGSYALASPYGLRYAGKSIYLIFPIGKYELIWNPGIEDLYNEISSIYTHNNKDEDEERDGMSPFDIEKIVSEYQKGNLSQYTPYNGVECMVHCDKYFAVKAPGIQKASVVFINNIIGKYS